MSALISPTIVAKPGERLVNARALPLSLHVPQPEVGPHLGKQFLVIERLDDVIVGKSFVAANPVGGRPFARDENHLHELAPFAGLDPPARLIAVDARHA